MGRILISERDLDPAGNNKCLFVCLFVFYLPHGCSTDRYCNKTTVINGVTIPKDATIVVPITLLHHSPLYWKDPEKFDPNRYYLTSSQSLTLHDD
jgi:hypothetical protein